MTLVHGGCSSMPASPMQWVASGHGVAAMSNPTVPSYSSLNAIHSVHRLTRTSGMLPSVS